MFNHHLHHHGQHRHHEHHRGLFSHLGDIFGSHHHHYNREIDIVMPTQPVYPPCGLGYPHGHPQYSGPVYPTVVVNNPPVNYPIGFQPPGVYPNGQYPTNPQGPYLPVQYPPMAPSGPPYQPAYYPPRY